MDVSESEIVDGLIESLMLVDNLLHQTVVQVPTPLILVLKHGAVVKGAREELDARPASSSLPKEPCESSLACKVCLKNSIIFLELGHETLESLDVSARPLDELLGLVGQLQGVSYNVTDDRVLLFLLLALCDVKLVEGKEQGGVEALHLVLLKICFAFSECDSPAE